MNDSTSIPPQMKRCSKCGEEKPLTEFHADKNRKDGRYPQCKACVREYGKRYYSDRADEIRGKAHAYYETHRDKMRITQREYYRTHFEEIKVGYTVWRAAHPEKHRAYARESQIRQFESNPDAFREKRRQQYRHWNATNPGKARLYRAARRDQQKAYERWYHTQYPDKARANRHNRRARIKQIGGYFTAKDIANMRAIQQGHCAYCGRLGQKLTIEHIIATTREGSSNDPWNLCLACHKCNSSKQDKLLEEWTDRWYLR